MANLEKAIQTNRQAREAIASGNYEKGQDLIRELEYLKEIADGLDEADVIAEFIEDRWIQTEAE